MIDISYSEKNERDHIQSLFLLITWNPSYLIYLMTNTLAMKSNDIRGRILVQNDRVGQDRWRVCMRACVRCDWRVFTRRPRECMCMWVCVRVARKQRKSLLLIESSCKRNYYEPCEENYCESVRTIASLWELLRVLWVNEFWGGTSSSEIVASRDVVCKSGLSCTLAVLSVFYVIFYNIYIKNVFIKFLYKMNLKYFFRYSMFSIITYMCVTCANHTTYWSEANGACS